MKLSLAHFDMPRPYPSGSLGGSPQNIVRATECTRLEFDNGAILVQKEGHPARYYAVGPKDWWEPVEIRKSALTASNDTTVRAAGEMFEKSLSGPSRGPDQDATLARPTGETGQGLVTAATPAIATQVANPATIPTQNHPLAQQKRNRR